MRPEEREELLASYALGTLSAPDAADVEQLVRHDRAAEQELVALHEIVDLIALSAPLHHADPSLRDRVLQAARRDRRDRRPARQWPRVRRYLPAAGLAAGLVIVMVWAVSLQQSLEALRSDTAALTAVVEADAKRLDSLADAGVTVAETRSLNLQLQTALKDQQLLLAVQSDPDVVTTPLESTPASHGAGGRYLWSSEADAGVLTMHDLPSLPFGSVYRVWAEDRFGSLALVSTFAPDASDAAQVVFQAEGGLAPRHVFVIAGGDEDNADGPVVLEATVGR